MAFCTRCGADLAGGRFCSGCGAPAGSAPAASPKLGDDALMRVLLPVGRSGWAIAAGYLGLFGLLVLPAPLALLAGLIAIRDLRRHSEKRGWGRAVFGTAVGAVGTVVLLAMLLFAHR
jgi:hypothetical protein